MSYAQGTKVGIDKTRQEIDRLLEKNRAEDRTMTVNSGGGGVIFKLRGRYVRIGVSYAARTDRRFTHNRYGAQRPASAAEKDYRQDCAERWRALLIVIKAKFAAIESGVESFEKSFMPDFVMKDGGTVYEHAEPMLQGRLATEFNPARMLPAPDVIDVEAGS